MILSWCISRLLEQIIHIASKKILFDLNAVACWRYKKFIDFGEWTYRKRGRIVIYPKNLNKWVVNKTLGKLDQNPIMKLQKDFIVFKQEKMGLLIGNIF